MRIHLHQYHFTSRGGLCLHDNASYENGVWGDDLHQEDVVSTNVCIYQKQNTLFRLLDSTHMTVLWQRYPAYTRYRSLMTKMPPKQAPKNSGKNKKKEFIWSNDEAERAGTCHNRVTIAWLWSSYSLKSVFLLFTPTFFVAPFLKSPLKSPDSEAFVLPMHFHRFHVNKQVKRRQISLFMFESVVV